MALVRTLLMHFFPTPFLSEVGFVLGVLMMKARGFRKDRLLFVTLTGHQHSRAVKVPNSQPLHGEGVIENLLLGILFY